MSPLPTKTESISFKTVDFRSVKPPPSRCLVVAAAAAVRHVFVAANTGESENNIY